MVLLPETVPFLAECMEGEVVWAINVQTSVADSCQVFVINYCFLKVMFSHCAACFHADECEGVEQLTQRVVATIEQILGEPIQQYF